MANNVPITAGSGTTVGTDDCGGVHISLVKLVDSTEDSTTRTGIAASPLQVSLANHAANATAVKVDGSAVTQPVSGTVAVTGVATAANQATIIGHVDGIEGLLTTIDADTGTIATEVTSIDSKITACNTGAVVISSGTITAVTAITNALPAGNNNIGDVDVASLPALPAGTNNIGDVDIVSLPALAAGTNLIGKASAGLDVSSAYDGSTALPIKFAAIAASSSGDNTVIAAVTSKKIRVLGYTLIAAGTVNVRFESGAGGTALTGVMPLIANMGMSPNGSFPQFETASNTLLNLELSAAVSVAGHITYVEV